MQTSQTNHHDVNRAIEVARGTSAVFTDHVPDCDVWTRLDGLDCLRHLQARWVLYGVLFGSTFASIGGLSLAGVCDAYRRYRDAQSIVTCL